MTCIINTGQVCSGSHRFLQTAFIQVMAALYTRARVHGEAFGWEHILPAPLATGIGIFALQHVWASARGQHPPTKPLSVQDGLVEKQSAHYRALLGGRCTRLRPWRTVCIAQVVKRSAQRRVVDVERRMVDGTPARVETLGRRSQGDGVINTASIERRNATCRERWASLTRRGRALARPTLTLQHRMLMIGTVYNFFTPACESRLHQRRDHTGDGCSHHGSWLDRPGVAVVSCPAAVLGSTHAARASLTSPTTPGATLVLVTTVKGDYLEIDTTVKRVLLGVESHEVSSSL